VDEFLGADFAFHDISWVLDNRRQTGTCVESGVNAGVG